MSFCKQQQSQIAHAIGAFEGTSLASIGVSREKAMSLAAEWSDDDPPTNEAEARSLFRKVCLSIIEQIDAIEQRIQGN